MDEGEGFQGFRVLPPAQTLDGAVHENVDAGGARAKARSAHRAARSANVTQLGPLLAGVCREACASARGGGVLVDEI
eukprot:360591-Chlamydomonas_euryale.AAC.11